MAEAEAQGVARVFWLTYRTTSGYGYGSYYLQHNAALAAAKVRHPNLVVLDWNTLHPPPDRRHPGAWFEADGIHMTRTGGVALAQYLKAAVDASACAVAPPPGPRTARSAAANGAAPTPDATATGLPRSPHSECSTAGPTKIGSRSRGAVSTSPPWRARAARRAPLSASPPIDPCPLATSRCTPAALGPTVATTRRSRAAAPHLRYRHHAARSPGRVCVYSLGADRSWSSMLTGWFAARRRPVARAPHSGRACSTRHRLRPRWRPAARPRSTSPPVPASATAASG